VTLVAHHITYAINTAAAEEYTTELQQHDSFSFNTQFISSSKQNGHITTFMELPFHHLH